MSSDNISKCYAVSGCDSGFGRILVNMLCDRGYTVFSGCYLKDSIQALKQENGNKTNIVPILLDITNMQSVEDFVKEVSAHIEQNRGYRLEGLVNNAGILIAPCPAEWQDPSEFETMFRVNVMGTAAMTKAHLPLIRRSRGRIVNVASVVGRVGGPMLAAYSASKFAVEAYSDILRRDMLAWGVTVHIIEPGAFSKTGLYGDFETGVDRKYQTLPEDVRKDYGEAFYQNIRKSLLSALDLFGNTESHLVSEAMMHALLDPKPKYRYRVGYDSKFLITPLMYVHESTQDLFFTTPPPGEVRVLPAAAPSDGTDIAWTRYDKGSWFPFLAITGATAYIAKQIISSAKL